VPPRHDGCGLYAVAQGRRQLELPELLPL